MKRGQNGFKLVGLFFVALFLVLASASFANSQNANVCCEKDNKGRWCQNVNSQGKCDTSGGLSAAPTACENTAFCQTGTCVDTNKGVCMPQTPKTRCESEGGTWKNKPKSQIDMCRNGCCIAGDQTAFTTSTQCKQIASDYGIDTNFRSDVTDEAQCLALAQPDERGACLTGGGANSTDCTMTTADKCNKKGGDFRKGMLCSAPGLSDCTWTGKTRCSDGDVYFVDTCGNLANVYDEDMYSENDNQWTQEMRDYWTFVQEPNQTVTQPSSSFGNCDYQAGTICKEYSSGSQGMPNDAPEYGNNVCADLGCYYDVNKNDDKGKKYFQHGESWCAQSKGTYPGIPAAGNMTDAIRSKIANPEKYNIPGSRYYQLKCWEGNVIKTACAAYRNEVCRQTTVNGNFSTAQCVVNEWRQCSGIGTRSECEAEGTECKWVEGYRFDGSGPVEKSEGVPGKRIDENRQGSCVPLFPPGFDFWKNDSEAQDICSQASVKENAIFETGLIGQDRDNFPGWGRKKKIDQCVNGCYAIPEYGKKGSDSYYSPSVMEDYEVGTAKISNANYVTSREGYFCRSDAGGSNKYTKAKTGKESNKNTVKCSGTFAQRGNQNDLAKRRSHIYHTHKQWLNSLQKRARMLGDCGVTPSIAGDNSKAGSEIITETFKKLNQDGTPKGNNNNDTESNKIYEGDADAK
ncbi:MAG: hypothetical protein ABEI74_01430 [Candidatus Pacearchaeota archaeon]